MRCRTRHPGLASDSIIDHWRRQFPDAIHIELPEAGHYIQEDAPEESIEAIRAAFGWGPLELPGARAATRNL